MFKEIIKKWLNLDEQLSHSVSNSTWASLYRAYKESDYENAYPYINLIASQFASQQHYLIDKDGNKFAGDSASGSDNLLARTLYPNDDMSDYDFREAMAIMALVHPQAFWKVHGKTTIAGGKKYIRAKDIKGFTPLFGVSIEKHQDEIIYKLPNGDRLEKHQVWIDREFNPENMGQGFTPLTAAKRWIKLDDYIADYQAGFFENGAVPAGQFIITASTVKEFEDVVSTLQERHRGAAKNNNVTYVHRPLNNNQSAPAQIEWVSFATGNKDLALKDLFEQTDKRIKQKFRIAPSLVGSSENNNLSSAQLDRKNFAETVMKPFTIKRWTRFNMNMNRITGGFSGAFGADVEIPAISEELKFKAEEKQINANTVANLVMQGFTAESAIEYVDTGDIRKLIEKPEKAVEIPIPAEEDIKDTPEMPIDENQQTSKHICDEHCHHIEIKKSDLKEEDYFTKKLDPKTRDDYENKLKAVIRNRMEQQIAGVKISKSLNKEYIPEEEDKKLSAEMLAVIYALMSYQGAIDQQENALLLASFGATGDIAPYVMSEPLKAKYKKYIATLSKDYNDQTRAKIQSVISQARAEGLPVAEIRKKLTGVIEDYRIERIARTEVHKAGHQTSMDSMKQLADDFGVKVVKKWQSKQDSATCPYCLEMHGTTIDIDEVFVKKDDTVVGKDGSVFTNNWEDLNTASLHANCRCRQVYEVVQ